MVRPVLSIDIPRTVAKSGSRGGGSGTQSAQAAQGSWTTGIVTEIGSGGAWVDIPADEPSSNAWGPTDGTLFAVGARVIVQLDSLGKVSSIGPAVTLPADVEVVATGAAGWAIMDAQSGVNETQEALTAAKAELESSQAELASNLSVTDAKLDAAQEYIDTTVTPGLEQAQSDAQSAVDAAAQAVADGVVSVVTEWAVGSSETTAPTSGWSTSTPVRTAGTFIWSRTTTTKGDGTATTSSPVLVTGNTGAKGDPGDDGVPGKDGVGLSGTVISYAKSTSGTSVPSSGWQATVPSSTPGQYLWTRTVWSYTDGTSETGYSVSMWGATGAKGDTGADGIAGKDGVGISSTSISYAASSSGTTAPTSGWASAPPSASAGQYVWTRTVWTYTDGTTETGYSVGKIGNTGAAGAQGVSVSSVTPYYVLVGAGASAPAKPTANPPSSSWTLTEPAYTSGVELWRCDLTVMSDGTWGWGAVSKVSSYTAASWAASQQGANLVADPSVSLGQWRESTYWKIDTTVGRTDSTSLRATNTSNSPYIALVRTADGVAVTIPVEPGQVWEVSGWCQTTSDWNGTAGNSKIRISNQDDSLFAAAYASASVDKWTRVKTRFTIPATGMTGMRVTLGANNTAGTIWWDDLSVRDVTEAQQALTVANLATAMAQGLVTASTTAPDVTQVGRVWLVLNGSGNVVGMKISNGSVWTSYTLMADQVLVPSSVGTVSLANGAVTAPKITATSELWAKLLNVAGDATIGGDLLVAGTIGAREITVTDQLWAKFASFVKVTTDMLIAGGATITGELLADVITLATRLVAGDPDGTRVELNETGLSVWRTLADGTAAQAINLGITGGGDYLSILSSGGDTLASIDEDGNVAGAQVTANDSIILAGEDLDGRLDAMPQGAIAKVYLNTSTFTLTTNAQTLVSTNVTLPGSAGRQLRVTMAIAFDGGSYPINIELKPSVTATASSANSTKKAWQVIGNSTLQTATFVYEINSDELGVDTTSRFLSLAMTGKTSSTGSGNAAIRSLGSYETSIMVEDLGTAVPSGRQANTSSGASQGSLTKTETYTSTASKSYQSSGAAYGYGGNRVFQGSYGSNSNLRGMWIFPTSILSDLSGATVNKVILRLTNQHSYANSGATARIVAHDSTSLPSTWSNPGSVIASVAFAKGQTRDIDLTSALKAGLKSGSIRGVGLYSTSSADYGYWSPTAKLIITYTK